MINAKKFNYSLLIREHHLDTFGHVNNATYLQLFEEARWEFLNEQGFNLASIQELGIGPVILECHLKFLRELQLREAIRIESVMQSFENKIGSMNQTILNAKDEICCEGKLVFGFFNLKTRKLIVPTTEWLTAIGIIA